MSWGSRGCTVKVCMDSWRHLGWKGQSHIRSASFPRLYFTMDFYHYAFAVSQTSSQMQQGGMNGMQSQMGGWPGQLQQSGGGMRLASLAQGGNAMQQGQSQLFSNGNGSDARQGQGMGGMQQLSGASGLYSAPTLGSDTPFMAFRSTGQANGVEQAQVQQQNMLMSGAGMGTNSEQQQQQFGMQSAGTKRPHPRRCASGPLDLQQQQEAGGMEAVSQPQAQGGMFIVQGQGGAMQVQQVQQVQVQQPQGPQGLAAALAMGSVPPAGNAVYGGLRSAPTLGSNSMQNNPMQSQNGIGAGSSPQIAFTLQPQQQQQQPQQSGQQQGQGQAQVLQLQEGPDGSIQGVIVGSQQGGQQVLRVSNSSSGNATFIQNFQGRPQGVHASSTGVLGGTQACVLPLDAATLVENNGQMSLVVQGGELASFERASHGKIVEHIASRLITSRFAKGAASCG